MNQLGDDDRPRESSVGMQLSAPLTSSSHLNMQYVVDSRSLALDMFVLRPNRKDEDRQIGLVNKVCPHARLPGHCRVCPTASHTAS